MNGTPHSTTVIGDGRWKKLEISWSRNSLHVLFVSCKNTWEWSWTTFHLYDLYVPFNYSFSALFLSGLFSSSLLALSTVFFYEFDFIDSLIHKPSESNAQKQQLQDPGQELAMIPATTRMMPSSKSTMSNKQKSFTTNWLSTFCWSKKVFVVQFFNVSNIIRF